MFAFSDLFGISQPNNACPFVSSRTPNKCEEEWRTDKGSLHYSQKNSIL